MQNNPQLNANGELRHLLSIENLPREVLLGILDTAASFVGVRRRPLRGNPRYHRPYEERPAGRASMLTRSPWVRPGRAAICPRSTMLRTVEAVLETDGNVRLLEAIDVPRPRRALVTILDDRFGESVDEAAVVRPAIVLVQVTQDLIHPLRAQ